MARIRRPSRTLLARRQKAVGDLAATCYYLLLARELGVDAETLGWKEYAVRSEEHTCYRWGVSEETIAETKTFVLEVLPGMPPELRDATVRAKRWQTWPTSEEATCPSSD